jgi:transposase
MKKAEKQETRANGRVPDGVRAGTGRRYGEAMKRQVVEELDSGRLTVAQAQRQYGVAGSQTIRNWQSKYGKNGAGVRRASALAAAQAQIERLSREKAELEHALARSSVKVIVLESAMEEAEAVYGEDFKKKFAPQRSNGREGGCGRPR